MQDIYGIVSSSTRRRILLSLAQCEKSFSDLMRSVAMDPEHDTGPFLYHIHRLQALDLVSDKAGGYSLTQEGESICQHLMAIRQVLGAQAEGKTLRAPQPYVGSERHDGSIGSRKKMDCTTRTSERMQEPSPVTDPVIRPLEERDIKDVLEVLSQEEFYRKQLAHMDQHLGRVARRGLDRYENNMVAEVEGRAVARMVVDTNYPPYSELAGLMVHTSHQDGGIGSRLISRFTRFARERGCPIQYVIVDAPNWRAQKLYTTNGFHPAILKDFHEKGREICMFRFDEGTMPREYLDRHPLAQLSVRESQPCGAVASSEMRWTDPLDGSSLVLHLEGRRHLAMPRIAGAALAIGPTAVRAHMDEHTERIAPGKTTPFTLSVENEGNATTGLSLAWILPLGADLIGPEGPMRLDLAPGASRKLDLALELEQAFDVPALGFTTVLATCAITIQESGLQSPIMVSAGFEKD